MIFHQRSQELMKKLNRKKNHNDVIQQEQWESLRKNSQYRNVTTTYESKN